MISVVSGVVIAIGLCYFLLAMVLGMRYARVQRREHERTRRAGVVPHAPRMELYFLVPCLNEERVIGDTVRTLLREAPGSRVVVIDDGSDDDTVGQARAAGGGQMLLVRRILPDARKGKGAALNHAYRHVMADVRKRGLDPEKVLVCVMDADGRVSAGAIPHVLRLFSDSTVGGAQLAVRIRNRDSFITRMQDVEFWSVAAIAQYGRSYTRSVSLGGNAQFTRLSALIDLGRDPWSSSLTEDLDLALCLMAKGWALVTTPHAWVEQEAVDTWRRLIRQRTRWYQGHMMCINRLPAVWRSTKLSHIAALEASLYVLMPWVTVLPWSLIFHYTLLQTVFVWSYVGTDQFLGSSGLSRVLFVLVWYLLSFLPHIVAGYAYSRRDSGTSRFKAVLYGHALVASGYVTIAAAWSALGKIIEGYSGWAKTTRSAVPAPARSEAA
ncbi:glycosyltransferase family 2 protein [Kutzneria albida]|uniref:N-acetyl-glucosamine transferase n=1 Tax=Kutzneria albida DSM 43870 TaxID=1449976 RepID=W5WFZ2_9PSEU|nr:glycosyltransferase family 2 protein [Kutzneria albida]AHH99635.1 hypothetical protein KALB_6275 [Kutzneria albida DSM 43870]